MSATINYRQMKPEDAEAVSEFCIRIFDELIAQSSTEQGRQAFVSDTSPEKLRDRASTHYFILVLDEEEIVGLADMTKDDYLKLLFVEREYQNRGIELKLLSWCIEAATAAGKRPAKITVKSAVDSVSYYENFGFKKDGDIQEKQGIKLVSMSLKLGI